MLLIVGANGWLGRQAFAFFRNRRYAVIAASHRQPAACTIDFTAPASTWTSEIPADVDRVIVLSAVTSIDDCCTNPARTRVINVDGPIEFFRAMRSRGVPLVYVSTDMVFAGDSGDYEEEDERRPTTEYGRQKKQAEDFLLEHCPESLVLRLSKLYNDDPDDPSPVGQTRRELVAGRRVRAAADQVVTPTHAIDVLRAAESLITAGHGGTFHIAAPERFTRLSLAHCIADRLGCRHLVEPCSIDDFPFKERRPRDNSLNTDKLRRTVDVTFSRVTDHLGA